MRLDKRHVTASTPHLEDWFTKESYREGGAQLVLLRKASKKPQRCLSSWQVRRWKSMLWMVSTSWDGAPEGQHLLVCDLLKGTVRLVWSIVRSVPDELLLWLRESGCDKLCRFKLLLWGNGSVAPAYCSVFFIWETPTSHRSWSGGVL